MTEQLGALSVAAVIFAGLVLLSSLLLLYPLQLILVHTLIETPYAAANNVSAVHGYGLAPSKDNEEQAEPLTAGIEDNDAPVRTTCAIDTMHTRTLFTAWANLRSCGNRGLLRAIPAQLVYMIAHELILAALGGVHPVMQLMTRITSSDPTGTRFTFSPLIILSMVVVKGVILLPLDIVITRQIIGLPDEFSWLSHLKILISTVGLRALTPLILPQVLLASVPVLLRNLNAYLHFLVLRETTVQPGWYAFFGMLEVLWQIASLIFVVAPLQAVVYRAHTSVIAHMPAFSSFISYPNSYISPLAELHQIVEEERDISGTWYGRYTRFFKVLAVASTLMVVVLSLVLGLWLSSGLLSL